MAFTFSGQNSWRSNKCLNNGLFREYKSAFVLPNSAQQSLTSGHRTHILREKKLKISQIEILGLLIPPPLPLKKINLLKVVFSI